MAALPIFIASCFAPAQGRFPGLRVDRTGAAIVGAGFMVAAGVLGFDEALRAADWAAIVLLQGIMIVVADRRLSGFFRLVAARVVRRAQGPKSPLAGVFSGFSFL